MCIMDTFIASCNEIRGEGNKDALSFFIYIYTSLSLRERERERERESHASRISSEPIYKKRKNLKKQAVYKLPSIYP